jgi:hypothetical protein
MLQAETGAGESVHLVYYPNRQMPRAVGNFLQKHELDL